LQISETEFKISVIYLEISINELRYLYLTSDIPVCNSFTAILNATTRIYNCMEYGEIPVTALQISVKELQIS